LPSSSAPAAEPVAGSTDIGPGVRVLVLGHGREGASAARFLTAAGAAVTVTDRKFAAPVAPEGESGIVLAPEDTGLTAGLNIGSSPAFVFAGLPGSRPLLARSSSHRAQGHASRK